MIFTKDITKKIGAIQKSITAGENAYDACIELLKSVDEFKFTILSETVKYGVMIYQYRCDIRITGKKMANGPDMHHHITAEGYRINREGYVMRPINPELDDHLSTHHQAIIKIRSNAYDCLRSPSEPKGKPWPYVTPRGC